MARRKNFLEQPAGSGASDADFEQLFARHTASARVTAHTIPIGRIRPNPFQARRSFVDLDELAQAIRTQGFTSRLRVRRDPSQAGYYQLVYGERRLRAAQSAGLTEVPVDIAEHTDDDLIEIGLAENIQRRDLDPLEEAQAFHTLLTQRQYTQQRLAERIGKDRGYVEERLALLRTPPDVQAMLQQRPDAIRAAREIAKLATEAQRRPLIAAMVSRTLSRSDVTALVRQAQDRPAAQAGPPDGRETALPVARRQPDTTQRDTASVPVPPSAAPPSSAFDRVMSRDVPVLRATLARWRLAVPALTLAQRAELLAFVAEHVAEVTALAQAMGEHPTEPPAP